MFEYLGNRSVHILDKLIFLFYELP